MYISTHILIVILGSWIMMAYEFSRHPYCYFTLLSQSVFIFLLFLIKALLFPFPLQITFTLLCSTLLSPPESKFYFSGFCSYLKLCMSLSLCSIAVKRL